MSDLFAGIEDDILFESEAQFWIASNEVYLWSLSNYGPQYYIHIQDLRGLHGNSCYEFYKDGEFRNLLEHYSPEEIKNSTELQRAIDEQLIYVVDENGMPIENIRYWYKSNFGNKMHIVEGYPRSGTFCGTVTNQV